MAPAFSFALALAGVLLALAEGSLSGTVLGRSNSTGDEAESAGGCGKARQTCDAARLAQTPEDYKRCWESRTFCCVAADLYGHPVNSDATPATHMYPGGGNMQWITGSDNLEAALEMRHRFGDDPKVSLGYQTLVGFNPIFLWQDGSKVLLVFKLKNETVKTSAFAPTFAKWFRFFQSHLPGVEFTYEVVKEIMEAYVTIGKRDVVSAWSRLTGCSRRCSSPVVLSRATQFNPNVTIECGCHMGVVTVWEKLSAYRQEDPYGPSCMQQLFNITHGKPTAGQVRVALAACEGVLPVFTGFGLGYNTIVSPLNCRFGHHSACKVTAMDRTAGREFVLPNMAIADTVADDVANMSLPGFPSEEWISENTVSHFC